MVKNMIQRHSMIIANNMELEDNLQPVATDTKLSKDDEASNVNPTLFKILVGSLMYINYKIEYYARSKSNF